MVLVFDPIEPTIDKSLFEKQDLSNYVFATDDMDQKESITQKYGQLV